MKSKKKKETPLNEEFDLRAVLNEINAQHGEGSVMLASEANLDITWVSSGCYAIDFATGGGFPESRISQIVGKESSGKTTLSLTTAVQFQKKYPKGIVVYLDVEKTFDKKYARDLGLDLTRVVIISPDSGEQSVDLAMSMIKHNVDVLMVVDSLAAMVPSDETQASMDQNFMGLHPRLINRFMRICTARMKRSLVNKKACKTTVICLNQIREKLGVMFGDPECLHGDTSVVFADGTSMPIREVVEKRPTKPVLSFDGKKFCASKISDYCVKPPAKEGELVTVTAKGVDTKNGVFSTTSTFTHLFLTSKGWKRAGKLKAGDELITKSVSVINGDVRDFLIGCSVGDCTFAGASNCLSKSLKFSDKNNPAYVQWKVRALSPYFSFSAYTDHRGYDFHISTPRSDIYRFKKEVGDVRNTDFFFDNYSGLALAVWIMDDGHLRANGQYTLCVGRAKHSVLIQSSIAERFKAVGLSGNWQKDGKRFTFDKASSKIINDVIAEYVPHCMEYKLLPGTSAGGESLYLKAKEEAVVVHTPVTSVKPASARKYRDRRLFDLHISGTATYVAGNVSNGVVVHNTTPGGRGKDFAASLTLKLFSSGSKANKIEEEKTVNGIKKAVLVGRVVSFTVQKNKCGAAPFETGEFKLFAKNKRYGFNNEEVLFETGLFHNVIRRKDDGTHVFDGMAGQISRKRKSDFLADLKADKDIQAELREEILEAILNPKEDADEIEDDSEE